VALDHVIPELDNKGLRKFAFTTGGIVAALFGLFFPWLLERPWPLWPWIIFAVFAALALLAPPALKPIYYGWMKFGLLASRVTTPVILGSVFFVLITPLGLFRRWMGQNKMLSPFEKDLTTYRLQSERRLRDNLEKPF
jgi:saxitoxin biosynthesis operon SxtJ-like protein